MDDPTKLPRGTLTPTTFGTSEVLASMDFETYSEAGYVFTANTVHGDVVVDGRKRWLPPYKITGKGLSAVGTPVYAAHPSTEVLSLYYDLKDGLGRRFWAPWCPPPADLWRHVTSGELIEAWNSTFEWYVWNYCCVRKYGFPEWPLEQARCAMAKSRRFSMPAALGKAALALGTPEKDKAGHNLIQKLCRPHTPTKNRAEHRWTVATAFEDYKRLWLYNDGDVYAEDCAAAKIPDLNPTELQVWLLDQRINARGLRVDVQTLDAAIGLHQLSVADYNGQLTALTNGEVETVNQNAKFRKWIGGQGYSCASLDADSRKAILADPTAPPQVLQAVGIAECIMSANIKKLYAIKDRVSADGRLRDQYKYCGADRTGRWSAGGAQLQNMTAKGPKTVTCNACGFRQVKDVAGACLACHHTCLTAENDWTVEAVVDAVEDVRTGDLQRVRMRWGQEVDLLCGILRGLFTASEGNKLVCCDFSAIEAVVLACLSRCQWRIDLFNTPGECVYTKSASSITGTPLEFYKAHKAETGAHHVDRKKIGKVAELASGYAGWLGAWKAFGDDRGDAAIKKDILAWRAASPEIVEFWGDEYKWCGPGKWDFEFKPHGLEGAAISAIQRPGHVFTHLDISYTVRDDILFCRLPSGRLLHYHQPRLHPVEDKLRRGPRNQITFMGWNSNAMKGKVGWTRMDTYGGRLTENVVQAVARDIQAEAMLRCEAAGYHVVLHTHDEICAEVPQDFGSVEEMESIMSVRPDWCNWWPIKAAGWAHKRYQKD